MPLSGAIIDGLINSIKSNTPKKPSDGLDISGRRQARSLSHDMQRDSSSAISGFSRFVKNTSKRLNPGATNRARTTVTNDLVLLTRQNNQNLLDFTRLTLEAQQADINNILELRRLLSRRMGVADGEGSAGWGGGRSLGGAAVDAASGAASHLKRGSKLRLGAGGLSAGITGLGFFNAYNNRGGDGTTDYISNIISSTEAGGVLGGPWGALLGAGVGAVGTYIARNPDAAKKTGKNALFGAAGGLAGGPIGIIIGGALAAGTTIASEMYKDISKSSVVKEYGPVVTNVVKKFATDVTTTVLGIGKEWLAGPRNFFNRMVDSMQTRISNYIPNVSIQGLIDFALGGIKKVLSIAMRPIEWAKKVFGGGGGIDPSTAPGAPPSSIPLTTPNGSPNTGGNPFSNPSSTPSAPNPGTRNQGYKQTPLGSTNPFDIGAIPNPNYTPPNANTSGGNTTSAPVQKPYTGPNLGPLSGAPSSDTAPAAPGGATQPYPQSQSNNSPFIVPNTSPATVAKNLNDKGEYTPSPTNSSSAVPGATNDRLAQQRTSFFEHLDNNPSTKDLLIKAALAEGGQKGLQANIEQMANYGNVRGKKNFDQVLNSGFYGPVNTGNAQRRILSQRDRELGEAAIEAVRKGSNKIDYRTDQGMAGDPNFAKEANNPQYRQKNIDGAYFADHPDLGGVKWAKSQQAADQDYINKNGSLDASSKANPNLYSPQATKDIFGTDSSATGSKNGWQDSTQYNNWTSPKTATDTPAATSEATPNEKVDDRFGDWKSATSEDLDKAGMKKEADATPAPVSPSSSVTAPSSDPEADRILEALRPRAKAAIPSGGDTAPSSATKFGNIAQWKNDLISGDGKYSLSARDSWSDMRKSDNVEDRRGQAKPSDDDQYSRATAESEAYARQAEGTRAFLSDFSSGNSQLSRDAGSGDIDRMGQAKLDDMLSDITPVDATEKGDKEGDSSSTTATSKQDHGSGSDSGDDAVDINDIPTQSKNDGGMAILNAGKDT